MLDPNPPGFGGSPDRLDSTGVGGASDGGSAGDTAEGGSGGTENPPEPAECTISFITPSPADVPHTFGPADDQDGIACGSSFSTNVVVSTSGAAVALFVDGSPWASQTASDAAATFNGVVLGSRSPATSSLRAVASMDDGRTCEVTLDSLGVDCAGPTCVLSGPNNNPWLTSDDDLDGVSPGLQTNFQVQTDAENAGQEVHLILNGDENTTLSATAQGDPAQAVFSNVTLTEGSPRTVQAECRDAEGNTTLSSTASWSVTLAACEVAFTTPTPGEDAITFGPTDDEDGEACGTDFTTHVDVTSNAASLTLFVDNQPVQTVAVSDGANHFDNVVLGTRSPLASALKVEATMADGRTCQALREALIVDCEGPSCTLVGPSTDPALNSSSDGDPLTAGLQADFRVVTNVENLGQPTRLIIDDDVDGALTGVSVDDNGSAAALYDQITLAEGPVRKVQAECEDALGNVTRSAAAIWLVDVTACGIGIDSIASNADPITRLLDAVPGGDIQVPVLGQLTGSDCTGVRVGVCGQSLGAFSGSGISAGDWSAQLTLVDVNASGQACAEVQDAAGNVAEARQAVNVRSSDPAVELASPALDSNINVAATNGALADLVPSSTTCEATFVVNCTDVGANVALFADAAPLGTPQPCVAVSALPSPYLGQATFTSVSLASQNGGETYSITAQQTVAGLVGTSAPVLVGADCDPPVVAIASPTCGGQLNLDSDDSQPDVGLQHDVDVSNGGVPFVQLTVTRQSGAPSVLTNTGNATTTSFTDVDFGTPGDVTLAATATDPAGNVGNASCQVTVVVAPTVDILVPAASAFLTTADDCDGGSGYGITVSGNTNASAGSDVEVAVGAGLPVALGTVLDGGGGPNTFSGCLTIGDGNDQTLTVTVTDGVNPPGSDTVTVNVDTLGPSDPVLAPTVSIVSARQGTVQFTWNHVEDSGGGLLAAYEMHCAASAIVDETGWTVADPDIRATGATRVVKASGLPVIPDLRTTPALASAPPAQETLGSFRVGTTEFCVIRGRDQTGALTPLNGVAGNATVTLPFTPTDFTTVVNASSSFTNVVGLGDINADGVDDMMYGVTNQGYQIFFGGGSNDAHPLDTTADITLINGTPSVSAFGAVMAPLGDVNGDGIADFAVSARALNTNRGTVFVFFGKATDSWNSPNTTPVTINAATGGCNADVCLVGSVASAFFGWDITGTDFTGTDFTAVDLSVHRVNDVVVSARANNSNAGTVYVIRGGTQFNVPAHTIINVPSGNPDGFVINAPASRSNFGVAVAAVGKGTDGKGDLGIGANGVSPDVAALFYMAGESYSGTGLIAPSATSPREVAQGSSTDYAAPVRAIGDFDGDGFGDLALGRNFSAGGGLGTAEVYLRNDSTPNTYSAGPGALLSFSTTGADNDYGTFIATGLHPARGAIGDLDGDGATELAIGTLGIPGGSVSLFYGSVRPAVPVARARSGADFTFAGSATGIMVPNFVGDIDHDGFNDLAIVEAGSAADHVVLLH